MAQGKQTPRQKMINLMYLVFIAMLAMQIDQEIIRSYKDQRADSLAGLQVKLLNAIDDDKLKKASAFQLVGSAALLYDKERLERGQATSISAVDIRQLIASVSVDTPEDMGVDMGVSGKDVTQNK